MVALSKPGLRFCLNKNKYNVEMSGSVLFLYTLSVSHQIAVDNNCDAIYSRIIAGASYDILRVKSFAVLPANGYKARKVFELLVLWELGDIVLGRKFIN